MTHDRLQFLTQFNGHLLNPFTSLVQSSLNCRVLYVVFFGDRCRFLESLCCFSLFPSHHVQITSQSRNHLSDTGAVLTHILENGCQDIDITQFVQCFEEHQQALVCSLGQRLLELLRIHARSLNNLILLLEHVHDQLRYSCGRHLYGLALRVEHGGQTHNLWNGHFCLGTYACHTLGEVGQVWC